MRQLFYHFRALLSGITFIILISCYSCSTVDEPEISTLPVDLVEPMVDAANSRWFFFNSATRPFGMVNLSPDMVTSGAWNSGYRYNQDTIRAFSHIHAWQLSGIPVLPTVGDFKGHLGSDAYGSSYSHEDELARPGYHQIRLKDYNINAELTSTTRVGFHRYTFPESEQSNILFDFSTFLGPCDTDSAYFRKVSATEIEGYAVMGATRRRPTQAWVYFVAQLDKPFDQLNGWKDGELIGEVDELKGSRIGAYLDFKTDVDDVRLMKVAISYVSIAQARSNMEKELTHWDFDRVVAESSYQWNEMLGRIKVEGGTEIAQRRFYTDLWHALQGRRIISDANGKYADFTSGVKKVGQIPLDAKGEPTFNHYNSDSFWGAQWTLNTLWHLVYPEITEEFVNSMLLMYKDGGLIPRGPSGGNYTYVMTGASSTPFITSAYLKGIRGFDIELAYEGMKKNHMPGGLMSKAGYEHNTLTGGGIEYYIDRGYIPHPLPGRPRGFHQDGSAQTLENAYQDWTLAQLAKVLGKQDDYEYFMQRSKNYQNIWYPEKGWMWVKTLDGEWAEPFDILEYGNGWVEGNAAQYTWWVPHDIEGLASLMGGKDSMSQKLNRSFELAQAHGFVSSKSHDTELREAGRRAYINYGNQPSIQTAFEFNHTNTPWLTQYWSRLVADSVYSGISPQLGYSGDEDQGLMGALAVLMKIGIFTVDGGTAERPVYEIGSTIFDKVTIQLNNDYYKGDTFVIETNNNSEANCYIQSAMLNEQTLSKPWFYHDELVMGGKLVLEMGSEANKQWGIQELN